MDQPFEPGPVQRLLAGDHVRLDVLFRRAIADRAGAIDGTTYAEFRTGLLRHIGMEEKILLPAAQRANAGIALPIATRLRREHGAIAALLVPTPSPTIVAALRDILARHNAIEEGPDGLYATCERLVGAEATALLAGLRAAPAVPVARHVDGPRIVEATRRALARAGYELADYES
jgi:hypothetical protein